MHCPQCGQQQLSEVVRFCSRCGFPLEGVIHLLANGGALPVYQAMEGRREISARRKGVKQGALLILVGAILVPLLGVILEFSGSSFVDVLLPLAAILCFVGGPLRMLYAAVFEEGAPKPMHFPAPSYAPPQGQMPPPARQVMLPPASAAPARGWQSRPITSELVRPPSVTENTTRLLDKQANRETDE